MRLGEKQEAFSADVLKLLTYIRDTTRLKVRIGEAQRPFYMQQHYVNIGRSKTLAGQHVKKLAIDLFFTQGGKMVWDKSKLQAIGNYWESLYLGNSWGGNWKSFKDVPHFERKN